MVYPYRPGREMAVVRKEVVRERKEKEKATGGNEGESEQQEQGTAGNNTMG
jgi:hypothetical protein